MRGSVALCLALASLALCLHASSAPPAVSCPPPCRSVVTASTAEQPQQQQPQWSGERRSWSRTKRQISEVVRLYNELSKENQEERQQALGRIREIINRVFVPANATTSTTTAAVPVGNATSSSTEGDVSTTTSSTSKPPPRVDRVELLANLRRNLRGLGRLFMRELRAALTQTRKNVATYGTELRESVRPAFSG